MLIIAIPNAAIIEVAYTRYNFLLDTLSIHFRWAMHIDIFLFMLYNA
jgi:hypothetical protein